MAHASDDEHLAIDVVQATFSSSTKSVVAADKYEMPLAIFIMLFSSFLHPSSIRLHSIACRMSWEKEAKLASTRTLTLDLLTPEVVAELVALDPKHRDKLIALALAVDGSTVFYANLYNMSCNPSIP